MWAAECWHLRCLFRCGARLTWEQAGNLQAEDVCLPSISAFSPPVLQVSQKTARVSVHNKLWRNSCFSIKTEMLKFLLWIRKLYYFNERPQTLTWLAALSSEYKKTSSLMVFITQPWPESIERLEAIASKKHFLLSCKTSDYISKSLQSSRFPSRLQRASVQLEQREGKK